MSIGITERPATGWAATAKQQEMARQARALHEEWTNTIGPGRVTADGAALVLSRIADRCDQLRGALERGEMSTEDHNDQRFVMVMAMRRLIDGGGEERASR